MVVSVELAVVVRLVDCDVEGDVVAEDVRLVVGLEVGVLRKQDWKVPSVKDCVARLISEAIFAQSLSTFSEPPTVQEILASPTVPRVYWRTILIKPSYDLRHVLAFVNPIEMPICDPHVTRAPSPSAEHLDSISLRGGTRSRHTSLDGIVRYHTLCINVHANCPT